MGITLSCYNATDTLKCLSELPFDTIYPALNITYEWFAVVDGAFVREWPVSAISKGNLVKVPLLLGSNTDEGVSFGTTGVNTDDQAVAQLISECHLPPPPRFSTFVKARLMLLAPISLQALGSHAVPG